MEKATKEEIEAVEKMLSETCNDPNLKLVTWSPTYEEFLRMLESSNLTSSNTSVNIIQNENVNGNT